VNAAKSKGGGEAWTPSVFSNRRSDQASVEVGQAWLPVATETVAQPGNDRKANVLVVAIFLSIFCKKIELKMTHDPMAAQQTSRVVDAPVGFERK